MYRCMQILGQRRAEVMIDMVREATGKDCPCLRNVPCPYFDAPAETGDTVTNMPQQRDDNIVPLRALA